MDIYPLSAYQRLHHLQKVQLQAGNKNVDFAGRIVYNEQGVEVFNFGKYKGMPVLEVLQRDPGYYSWILQGDFTLNTKNVLTKIRLRTTGMTR